MLRGEVEGSLGEADLLAELAEKNDHDGGDTDDGGLD